MRTLMSMETADNLPIIVRPEWAVELPAGHRDVSNAHLQAFGKRRRHRLHNMSIFRVGYRPRRLAALLPARRAPA